MARRISGILATIGLVTAGLLLLGTSTAPVANAAFEDPVPLCSAPHAPPCLVSLTRSGVANPAGYRVAWNQEDPTNGFYSWFVEKDISGVWRTDMGVAEEGVPFSVAMNFGAFNPRTAAAMADPAGAHPGIWSTVSGNHYVTITGSPIYRVPGCVDGDPPTCPTTGVDEEHGYLDTVVNNANWFGSTAAEHQLAAGLYSFRNTDLGGEAPVLLTDAITGAQTLVFTLLNSHRDLDSVTFVGEEHLRLPNAMLHDIYGIPAPDTMTASSLATSLSGTGGSISIRPEATHRAMLIDVTGVTFSKRLVRIRLGAITPMRPGSVRAVRVNGTHGRVSYLKARPRGAYPTGYQLRCVSGRQVRTASGGSSTTVLRIRGLTPGRHYSCRVRATSRVGPGLWSYIRRL